LQASVINRVIIGRLLQNTGLFADTESIRHKLRNRSGPRSATLVSAVQLFVSRLVRVILYEKFLWKDLLLVGKESWN